MSDWKEETHKHIRRVLEMLTEIRSELTLRGLNHDQSKFSEEEAALFEKYTSKLYNMDYMSEEYKECLNKLKPALEHHYANNRHHPEFHANGVNDMTLIDLVEMLVDWKAATERHESGDILKSIKQNSERFGIDSQLTSILLNTARDLGWISHNEE